MRKQLYPSLQGTILTILDRLPEPDAGRKAILRELAAYIRDNPGARNLMFVCTHNSRRSHMAQMWAAAAAAWFGVDGVQTFSGGSEVTAMHLNTLDALTRCGFEINVEENRPSNPVYKVLLGGRIPHIKAFSKTITDKSNPRSGFCAVMVCSEAEEACPVVHGATKRILLTYEDPKVSDDTPEQKKTYLQRSHQIGREMLWAFEQAVQPG